MSPRTLVWLALWGSIQIFLISLLSATFWRVQQIYRSMKRLESNCRRSVKVVKDAEAAILSTSHLGG